MFAPQTYMELAKTLKARANAAGGGIGIIMPSMSKSQKKDNRDATDVPQAMFSRDMHNNPNQMSS
jgi:hypothetical protein